MKNENKNFDHYTSEASRIGRQLILTTFATIWLFINQNTFELPYAFKYPLILSFLYLAIDLSQYILASIFSHYNEKKYETFTKYQNSTVNCLFYSKMLILVFNAFIIIKSLISLLKFFS